MRSSKATLGIGVAVLMGGVFWSAAAAEDESSSDWWYKNNPDKAVIDENIPLPKTGELVDIREGFAGDARALGDDDIPYRSEELGEDVIPDGYVPWWQPEASGQLGVGTEPVRMGLDELFVRASQHSTQMKVFSDIPLIRETAVDEAQGRLDPRVYAEGKATDLDEPVGSTLKTGGPDRFLEQEQSVEVGVRKKLITGTEVEVSHSWGLLDNNSEFLQPKDQASTRIGLSVTQPLLNGFGPDYNSAPEEIARIDASAAFDEYKRQAESHLLEIERAYWSLYLERAALLQRRKLVADTGAIVQELEGRQQLDAMASQVAYARAELSARRSDLARSELGVRNAEAKLLSLVNDDNLIMDARFELVPEVPPMSPPRGLSTGAALKRAIENRPEVDQGFKQLAAAIRRRDMAEHELLPALDLVLEYYRDGLSGNDDLSAAFDEEFERGDGSVVAGLVFEMPLGNREAEARHRRRQVEVRQLTEQLRTTLETLKFELQVSMREIRTAYREMSSKYLAMEARRKELETLEARRSALLDDTSAGPRYLERILDAQERLAQSENEFLRARVSYAVALANRNRATGKLLESHDMKLQREDGGKGLPGYRLRRTAADDG